MSVRRLAVAVALALALAAGAATLSLRAAPPTVAPLPAKVEFNRDIRPILADACYQCHGPDKGQRKAGLRVDTRDGLFGKHKAVVPGQPAESELYLRLISDDADERMPQAESNKTLTPRQIALVKKWIEQGAEYQGHWAYEKVARPTEPAVAEPGFVRNPVDRFVLARQQEVGLTHAPEADRVTLIRRLSFDLTGLPPSPAEVEAFLADRSPDAYEKVVDRLLASPHYGERMAMYWLDLVRFADTIGYHSDNPMNVAPYRDWVIRAFNANEPFDRFTTEQLAGDLLPAATVPQQVASAYNRLLQTTEEGGAQAAEYIAKYAADRVRNVSTVWLGTTMGCCQCHDHKFDPFSMRDFYAMSAFFADVQEAAVGRREPGIPVPEGAKAVALKALDEEEQAIRQAMRRPTLPLHIAQLAWELELLYRPSARWVPLVPDTATAGRGLTLSRQGDDSLKATGFVPDQATYTITARAGLPGVRAVRLEVLPDADYRDGGPGLAPNGNFVLTAVKVKANGKPVQFVRALADFAQDGYPVVSTINAKKGAGWAVLPETGKKHTAIFDLAAPLGSAETRLTITLEHQSDFGRHQVGRFRLAVTRDADTGGVLALPEDVRAALAVPIVKRTDRQSETLAAYFRSVTPLLDAERVKLAAIDRRREDLLKDVPRCLVTKSGPPRTVRVLARGNWLDKSGEVVQPAFPRSLAQSTGTGHLTRFDLARWIVARDNPLTARVFVNRLWKLYFGQGLAKTLDDVGAQGEWPTHPELLDWLAAEFVDRGWDMKAMVRLLVTSGTYRQAADPTPRQKELDPYNRFLARQARFRLDAEIVRDNVLSISGLLNPQVGGASVFPYQPAGYWAALNFPPREWHNDSGARLYRRGMYTHWQRSFPQPSLLAFDAPSREECTVERPRSNIPQQALVLLNDPTYVEAARTFAERILAADEDSTEDRVRYAFTAVLSRPPTADEVRVLVGLYDHHRAQYAVDREAADKLLHVGDHPLPADEDRDELAAWTSVARALFNLHESITRP